MRGLCELIRCCGTLALVAWLGLAWLCGSVGTGTGVWGACGKVGEGLGLRGGLRVILSAGR